MTIELLHGVMLAGAGVNACCAVVSRRSHNAVMIVSTLLMAAAMLDAGFGWLGMAPLVWTGLLLAWAMVSGAFLRPERGREIAVQGTTRPDTTLHLFHTLGLVVLAAQLTAHSMTGTAGTAESAHEHELPILPLVVAGAGLLFIGYTLVLVLGARRTRGERGTLLSMGAMTLAMGWMPLL
jgi:hypothetical protein